MRADATTTLVPTHVIEESPLQITVPLAENTDPNIDEDDSSMSCLCNFINLFKFSNKLLTSCKGRLFGPSLKAYQDQDAFR